MLLYLLVIPFVLVLLSLVGKLRSWSILSVGLVLLLLQGLLLWWLPVGVFLLWAQTMQLLALFTLAVTMLLSSERKSTERMWGQLYFSLFSFFSLAVLLMPVLWAQAGVALIALLIMVIWFSSQRKLRLNLGLAMMSWFYTVMGMAMQLHLLSSMRAQIIGSLLIAIALLGLVIFYCYRFWLSLWLFCFHWGLTMLLLWIPGSSAALAGLIHSTFFLVALMFITLSQYFFSDTEDELLEYEKGTMITLGFWRVLRSLSEFFTRTKVAASEQETVSVRSHFSVAHGVLFVAILLVWCMPPTVLFITMFLLLSQILAVFATSYWIIGALALVIVLFTIISTKRLLALWLHARPVSMVKTTKVLASIYALVLLIILVGASFWLPDQLMDALQKLGTVIQS